MNNFDIEFYIEFFEFVFKFGIIIITIKLY
jgi:hypothetical protein